MFGIGGCLLWAQRRRKCEHQMTICVTEQKVTDSVGSIGWSWSFWPWWGREWNWQ